MPGRHSGDQVHKVKKNAAPLFLINCIFRYDRVAAKMGYGYQADQALALALGTTGGGTCALLRTKPRPRAWLALCWSAV